MFRSIPLLLFLALGTTLTPAAARPAVDPDAPTVILVHGAFADASSWDQVAKRLRRRGVPVVAVDNPLSSLEADVDVTRAAIAAAPGKVVLVGHSWGGTVITQAGVDPKVTALVYVAAFAPDVGQTSAQQGEHFPVAPGLQQLLERDGWLSLSPQTIARDFAQDLTPRALARVQASQLPLKASALAEPVTAAAWRSRPSWYVVSRKDRMLAPQLQVATAQRIGATLYSVGASHVAPVSEPGEVSNVILEASGLRPADAPTSAAGG
ncbi:alpha/beta fold hydrolase [Marilutibacter chinensis]|uniref:Alpha/beta hydrolase n=1 Tax=Marilutibacter chinensis TaxID=2912247 RepID=A0ABS9HZX7_9GAMM|nr:alpha/beta hydrolase [Lysobacter chinensis]MCF7223526.1 alpha/beta hydrolase [Lysobacter chinensis]MCF7223742.1 alpha/beta hydrolase [Lysobacter chinensis]